MLYLVAIGAGKLSVLIGHLLQQLGLLGMATCAEGHRRFIRVADHFGHMRIVTAQAIVVNHLVGMGLMALHAAQIFAMLQVTEGTILFSMLAREFPILLPLNDMAGDTDRLQCGIAVKGDFKRSVGVMTTEATGYGIMLFDFGGMAPGAFGKDIAAGWRVLEVAVDTVDSGSMPASPGGQLRGQLVVAFDAVAGNKRPRQGTDRTDADPQQGEGNKNQD